MVFETINHIITNTVASATVVSSILCQDKPIGLPNEFVKVTTRRGHELASLTADWCTFVRKGRPVSLDRRPLKLLRYSVRKVSAHIIIYKSTNNRGKNRPKYIVTGGLKLFQSAER